MGVADTTQNSRTPDQNQNVNKTPAPPVNTGGGTSNGGQQIAAASAATKQHHEQQRITHEQVTNITFYFL